MSKTECLRKSEIRMAKNGCLSLILLWLVGCGPRIPDEFTVSGQSLDHWLEALADNQTEVRTRAVRALSNVGPDFPEVVDALSEALSDPDPGVRSQAALALLKFGPGARAAIPALTDAQTDSDETVRSLVAKALEKIHGS
jgi:HEAT repeat protein